MKRIVPRNNNGSIILRFIYGGKRYSFNPVPGGKFNDKLADAKSLEVASRVYQDCIAGYFDTTLAKYKVISGAKAGTNSTTQNTATEGEFSGSVNLLFLFEDYAKFKSKTLKANSMIDYDRIKNKLKKCPHKLVGESVLIMQWLVSDHKGSSTSSLEKAWKLINACCNWAVASQKIENNPFKELKKLIPKTRNSGTKEEINPFSLEERERIILAFKNSKSYSYYTPLVEFLFMTGCRPEEALALQWKHIKGNRVTFCQKVTAKGDIEAGTKTQEKRSITMNERTRKNIDFIKPDGCLLNDFLFPAKKGGLIDWHNFANRAWKSVVKNVPGVEYRNPYQMRHTCITLMVKNGVDSTVVAKWVGNSPNMIAKRYLGNVGDISMPNT